MKIAADHPCCQCGAPAVAWWPCVDPDIPSRPYCKACLAKAQEELLIALYGGGPGSQP